jgi:hypothetical protein
MLATTKQFRDAARAVFSNGYNGQLLGRHSYTDRDRSVRDNGVRYVSYAQRYIANEKIVKSIEFLLFAQGVTANTRVSKAGYLKGTCVLDK